MGLTYMPDQWCRDASQSSRILRSHSSNCEWGRRFIPAWDVGITVCHPSPSSLMPGRCGSPWGEEPTRDWRSDELLGLGVEKWNTCADN